MSQAISETELDEWFDEMTQDGYLGSGMRVGTIRVRLQRIYRVLTTIDQDDDESIEHMNELIDDLISSHLIQLSSTNDDIKIYLAACLIEVLRILAPESPYTTKSDNKMVFRIIIESLANFASYSVSVSRAIHIRARLRRKHGDSDLDLENGSGQGGDGSDRETSQEQLDRELSQEISNDTTINEDHINYYQTQLKVLKLFRNLEAYVLLNQFKDSSLV